MRLSNSKVATKSILKFYANKAILITGVTVYLAKLIIEKLLRSCSSLKEILIVIRPKSGKCANECVEALRNNNNSIAFSSDSIISEFYANKTIFVTGGTGYLGKLLLEKLLRSCSTLKEILVLVRPKKGKTVDERIKDLRNNDIFECVRKIDINLLMKIQPVTGDLTEDYLGLQSDDLEKVINSADIFIHLGAAVHFEAPLKYLVANNITGVQNAINVAQKMKHLHAFVNVTSSAAVYNNGQTEEIIYPVNISSETLMNITKDIDHNIIKKIARDLKGDFINTYAYTKAVADTKIQEQCQNLQVGVLRPPGVGPLYKEPIPGWQDNFNVVSGLCFGIANGTVRILNAAPSTQMYLVPGDYTINCLIAIAWEVANKPTGITVYNFVENYKIPAELLVKHYTNFKYPLEHCMRYPSTWMIPIQSDKFHNFLIYVFNKLPAIIWDRIYAIFGVNYKYGRSIDNLNKMLQTIAQLHKKRLIFNMSNTNHLWKSMTAKDKAIFNFDLNTINWEEYLGVIAYGLKTILLKEDMANINYAKMKYYWLMIQHYTWRFLLIVSISTYLFQNLRNKL